MFKTSDKDTGGLRRSSYIFVADFGTTLMLSLSSDSNADIENVFAQ